MREVANQCLSSQRARIERGRTFKNYFFSGSERAENAAQFNKTFAYIDELASLLFSPIALRFHISDQDYPNVVEEAKGRAASAKLRAMSRQSNTDNVISEANLWALVKGKTFVKQTWKRGNFAPTLIQPEAMGVMNENMGRLDEDMEAFTHSYLITPHAFNRMIWSHPNREALMRRAKKYTRMSQAGMSPTDGAMKQVIVGGIFPFQAAGAGNAGGTRPGGVVDWMGGPSPQMSPEVIASLMQVDETWIWDDAQQDWATFQIIGDDMLINSITQIRNEFAFDPISCQTNPTLKGKHPFIEFCSSPTDEYFWGRSEIVNVALLQEALNSRITGINIMLRKQEDPPKKFVGSTGVNQQTLSRFSKPGGYWTDTNPNAKIEIMAQDIPESLYVSLHEIERMFDEMGGLPPQAKGHGQGVRSAGHADTLIRMFSPRFKDRALLVERSVEELGGLMLDIARVHEPKRMIAWCPDKEAGVQGVPPLEGLNAPAEGLVAVPFTFADLDDDVSLVIDAHSSSPAFSADARAQTFDLLKIGAMGPEDVVDHSDVNDPEQLIAGIQRRAIAKAKAEEAALQAKMQPHAKK